VIIDENGKYTIIDGFVLNNHYKELVKKTNDELLEERSNVL